MQDKNLLESTTLEQDVNSALGGITPNKGKYRCYEIARLLRNRLVTDGYEDATVKTGVVWYDINFLEELFIEKLKQNGGDKITDILEKESKLNPPKGKTPKIKIFHSWVEIRDIVIDYQNNIQLPRNESYSRFQLIRRKDELVDKAFYNPNGREVKIFGKTFVYIPPLYFTKLEI